MTLNFVRNLISIDDPELAQVIVICYADSGMARLIQYIASAADLDEWHLHATEIFSGLLKDTTPKSISHVDPQKDALKHCSFMRPCLSIQETKVEVSHLRLFLIFYYLEVPMEVPNTSTDVYAGEKLAIFSLLVERI